MKNLTIKPVAGGEIQFGKFPLFSRNIGKVLGLSDVDKCPITQFKVEGRYFAVELKPNAVTLSNEFDAHLKTAAEAVTNAPEGTFTTANITVGDEGEAEKVDKTPEEEVRGAQCDSPTVAKMPYDMNKKATDLTDLGFTNLADNKKEKKVNGVKPSTNTNRFGMKMKGEIGVDIDFAYRPIKQGNFELTGWLKSQDYLVYKLFVFSNGQVAMDKYIDHEDAEKVFAEAGVPRKKLSPNARGTTASRLASVSISQLMRSGVISKGFINDKPKYSLSVVKGGQYARGVYRTVNARTYGWDDKKGRVLYGEA